MQNAVTVLQMYDLNILKKSYRLICCCCPSSHYLICLHIDAPVYYSKLENCTCQPLCTKDDTHIMDKTGLFMTDQLLFKFTYSITPPPMLTSVDVGQSVHVTWLCIRSGCRYFNTLHNNKTHTPTCNLCSEQKLH